MTSHLLHQRSLRVASLSSLVVVTALALTGCSRGEASGLETVEPVGEGSLLDGGPAGAASETAEAQPPRASTAPATVTGDEALAAGGTRGPAGELEPRAPEPAPPGTERVAGESRLITFGDLSLIGLDVDAIFDPSEDEVGLAALPETIRALDGVLVALEGYMIPMEWEGTRVRAFMLVRDMAGCCFGQMPQPDEWVEVVMHEDEVADYYPYVPVLVTGIFELAGETDDLGYVTGAYRLRGDEVTDEW